MAAKTAKPLPPAKKVPGRVYSTFNPGPATGDYAKGDVLKLGKNQEAKFSRGLGWYAAPKVAASKPKITVEVNKGGTAQNYGTSIESPAQIEARVTRMAQSAYDRQKGDMDLEVARMRREAEGRRLGMIAAYQAAGNQSAEMASRVQDGWNVAANNLQGIAGAATGGIGDALRADTATQEQALSRVGAGGTGFDATSQQAVEQFRGGALPAEFFTRKGGIANEYLERMPDNLKRMGLQTADATFREAGAKLAQDRLAQVRTLGENRTKYETDLREQLLGARKDQMDALVDAQKALADAQNDAAKLEYQYWNARQSATTKKELQQVEMIYKNEKLRQQGLVDAALIAQRNASAGLSDAKAGALNANPGGLKPPSATAISNNVARANKAGDAVVNSVLANIWAKAPGKTMPADFMPGKPQKDRMAAYQNDPRYLSAVKWANDQRTRSFGTANKKVILAIHDGLKALGYTDAKIRSVAYEIVTRQIQPPANWKLPPGYKAAPVAALPANLFGGFGTSKLPSTLS